MLYVIYFLFDLSSNVNFDSIHLIWPFMYGRNKDEAVFEGEGGFPIEFQCRSASGRNGPEGE